MGDTAPPKDEFMAKSNIMKSSRKCSMYAHQSQDVRNAGMLARRVVAQNDMFILYSSRYLSNVPLYLNKGLQAAYGRKGYSLGCCHQLRPQTTIHQAMPAIPLRCRGGDAKAKNAAVTSQPRRPRRQHLRK